MYSMVYEYCSHSYRSGENQRFALPERAIEFNPFITVDFSYYPQASSPRCLAEAQAWRLFLHAGDALCSATLTAAAPYER